MRLTLPALVTGWILDMLIGDPHFLWHPVQGIGALISFLEKGIRRLFKKSPGGEKAGGVVLALLVIVISVGVPAVLLAVCCRIHRYAGFALQSILCYQMLACKSLKTESMKVCHALQNGSIEDGRYAVSMIVGRDTESLDQTGIVKAAVETVAENASDGVIAPLFYMAVGGPLAGICYKAINTMDSMIGYKNDKYLYLGRFAAKLDDVVNYIPARLSAWVMIAASWFCRMDAKQAVKIYKRDRYNHASPNSAHTEAVMAGALNVALAGDAWYFGKLHKKPFIGDPLRAVETEDIRRANRLLYAANVLFLGLVILVYLGVGFMLK